jgi:hypothetical protein
MFPSTRPVRLSSIVGAFVVYEKEKPPAEVSPAKGLLPHALSGSNRCQHREAAAIASGIDAASEPVNEIGWPRSRLI